MKFSAEYIQKFLKQNGIDWNCQTINQGDFDSERMQAVEICEKGVCFPVFFVVELSRFKINTEHHYYDDDYYYDIREHKDLSANWVAFIVKNNPEYKQMVLDCITNEKRQVVEDAKRAREPQIAELWRINEKMMDDLCYLHTLEDAVVEDDSVME